MNFSISFRSELLKTRRASPWYAGILIALFVPAIIFIDFSFQDDISEKIAGNPWSIFMNEGFVLFNMILCPLYVLLITTILPQMEYKNNTWKQVMVSPQPLLHIYLARFCVVLLLLAVFIVTFAILMVTTGMIIDIFWPKYGFSENQVDVVLIIKKMMHTMICVLGISGLQFWIGIRCRNFIVPLSVGFGFWLIATILTLELRIPHPEYNPFTYLAHASFPKFAPMMPQIMLSSVAYCLTFLTLGFMEFNRNRIR